MSSKAMSLKAKIRNYAKSNNIFEKYAVSIGSW